MISPIPLGTGKQKLVAALIAAAVAAVVTLFPQLSAVITPPAPAPAPPLAPQENKGPAPAAQPDDPPRFFGWVNDPDAVKSVCEELGHPHFEKTDAFQSRYDGPEDVFLWDAARKVTGNLLPPRDQGQVGCCVAFGTASAI